MHTMHQHRFNNTTCHIQHTHTHARDGSGCGPSSTAPSLILAQIHQHCCLPICLRSAFLRTSGTRQLGALCTLASSSPICRRQRQHRGPAGCLVATARMPVLCQCSHVCRPEALPAEDGVQPLQLTASCS
jgi:hypothetical protein